MMLDAVCRFEPRGIGLMVGGDLVMAVISRCCAFGREDGPVGWG
jgi:hypothetical protein